MTHPIGLGVDNYLAIFSGKSYDATGLIYFNARYYNPTTRRFLTEDPSRKGVNWHAYCENNPINKIDPKGLQGTFARPEPLPGVEIGPGGEEIFEVPHRQELYRTIAELHLLEPEDRPPLHLRANFEEAVKAGVAIPTKPRSAPKTIPPAKLTIPPEMLRKLLHKLPPPPPLRKAD